MAESSPSAATDPPSRLTGVPPWVPLAAFAGTSIALAVPLVYISRQRRTVLRKALSPSAAPPPPRRAGPSTFSSTSHLGLGHRPPGLPPQPEADIHLKDPSSSEFSSPGTRELLSAIAKVNLSTAVFAGKAFVIATGLVTLGGIAFTVGVKEAMGVRDTKEFAERMRSLVWRHLPSLTSQIHRPLAASDSLPLSSNGDDGHLLEESDSGEPDRDWTWGEAEKRLQAAYDVGGATWVKAAAREMAAEARVERARRVRVSLKGDSEIRERKAAGS